MPIWICNGYSSGVYTNSAMDFYSSEMQALKFDYNSSINKE